MRKRILLGFMAVSLVVTTVGFIAATQFAAASLGYQKQLGDPTTIAGLHLYAPWSWMAWESDFGPYAPAIFRTVKIIGWSVLLGTWTPLVITALVITLLAIPVLIMRGRWPASRRPPARPAR